MSSVLPAPCSLAWDMQVLEAVATVPAANMTGFQRPCGGFVTDLRCTATFPTVAAYLTQALEVMLGNCRRRERKREKGKVIIMGCEKMGDSISFESFESDTLEHISVEEAEKQGEEAEELREEK